MARGYVLINYVFRVFFTFFLAFFVIRYLIVLLSASFWPLSTRTVAKTLKRQKRRYTITLPQEKAALSFRHFYLTKGCALISHKIRERRNVRRRKTIWS